MTPVSREWATPLTIGAFALMAGTGLLMFFHLDNGLQKSVHEWLGWLLVAAVVVHAAANWLGFKRYFQRLGRGQVILVACALGLVGSFFIAAPTAGGAPPTVLALRAVAKAPLSTVALLAHKPVEQVRSDLAAMGIEVADANASIESAVQGQREQLGRAITAVLAAPAASH